ncbi:MAG: glycerol-3-phosphate 1-O-acyltransferase [Lachnospiraceae bacterium]|uniref:Glycerol-3-phosphate acyltransferase n=1 Tax=Candidatus Weimeria bifida TaxID=2599074 RepID=A0A6N7IXS2_9FIRM|nr:glycerol-3-phosphate 1-O-acyltransferase PlsY [Candidatus Weimeria bifida]RRF96101.1 MAG: glycerol-3-phosphate 1-O-acyltransferase [Lachnospiraceae bacterium]
MLKFLAFLLGYAFGNVPSGYLMGKAEHVDITKQGSGNIGTTNTLRVLGNLQGALCLLFDCMKGVVPALIMGAVASHFEPESKAVIMFFAALGAVIGHDFPATMHFKGGKGIATSLGLFIIAYPIIIPFQVAVFVITVAITRFVSLGSILCAISFPFMAMAAILTGHTAFTMQEAPLIIVLSFGVGALAVWRHHSNIGRLITGNENKFSFHHKKKEG